MKRLTSVALATLFLLAAPAFAGPAQTCKKEAAKVCDKQKADCCKTNDKSCCKHGHGNSAETCCKDHCTMKKTTKA